MTLQHITLGLGLAFKLFSAYFALIMLFAALKPRPHPAAAPKTRFAVVIAARNEAAVIGRLVESLRGQHYPAALYDIYVVPNNCTDNTRFAALRAGARVIDCHGPVKAKGEALAQAFEVLLPRQYDAFCVFDADNVVDARFLAEMNNAFCQGARVAKGRNEAGNPRDSWISGCYAIYFGIFNHFYNRGRAVLGLSAKLVGTGFAVHRDVLAVHGWCTETLAEDAEFAAQCALWGERVAWVPRAVAYDEEPLTLGTSLRQRRRWCSGIVQVSLLMLPPLLRARGRRGCALRLDSAMFLLAPFFQACSIVPLGLNALFALADGPSALPWLAGMLAMAYGGAAALAVLVVTLSRQWSWPMAKSVLTFPLFMATWLPLQMLALVRRTTVWEQIAHGKAMAAPRTGVKPAPRY